jgi:hypothetical protein
MTTSYRLTPGVRWVVNRASLTITDGHAGVHTLDYPDAAIWDLFARGYSFSKVVAMTVHIAAVEPAAADAVVRASLDRWAGLGLLEPVRSRVIPMRAV